MPVFDIAADPSNADVLVGTTENGLVRSTDGGRTFAPIPAPGLLALVAWSPGLLAAVDVDGAVQVSRDGGSTWQAGAVLAGQPLALANDGTRIAVLVDDVVHESEDGGATFTERLAGIHVG